MIKRIELKKYRINLSYGNKVVGVIPQAKASAINPQAGACAANEKIFHKHCSTNH